MADCCASVLEFVKGVGKHVVTEVLWPPVKHHIDYSLCCSDNVGHLRDEIRGLEIERRNMEQRIKEGQLRADSATADAENWSREGTKKLEVGRGILQKGHELKPWNIVQRYSVGKSAKRTAEDIAKLRHEGNSITITCPANPRSMGFISREQTMVFESRRRIEDQIMESLTNNHASIIAICGVEGVGKTTMAQIIEERVRSEKLFEEVVLVVVGQQINMLNIQEEMAEILGLKLTEKFLVGRAHKIRTRLLDKNRKLIIFDDVRKSFKLMDIGVPFEGCKIILTSRFSDVCEEMEARKVVQIQALDEEEAWTLFRAKSGECEDNSVSRDVAAECKGLPLALVTTGKALRNKSIHAWKDSLLQRRRANAISE